MIFIAAALVIVLVTPCASWTSSAYMDLISPPRWTTDVGDRYMIKAGEIQPGFTNSLTSCLNEPTPLNVTRSLFPISGGSLVFGFVNDTISPNPDPTDEKFWLDLYLTDDKADYSDDYFFKFGNQFRRMEFWQGFRTGWSCSVGFNMTSQLRQPTNETAMGLLEGMNITIALLIKLGRGPYRGDPNWAGNTWDEVHQCAYVTLTSDTASSKRELEQRDENQDMCNRVNLDWFRTPTTSASGFPTMTSSANPTESSSIASKRRIYNTASTFSTSTAFLLALFNSQF
ncbi:hypothetical protein BKA65DRAFT_514789 [Rhexocercosporidium sp. MPI-PUGE-AT-0058]|nr:hypothetical protein BKA65DRAFT_514789 [Rhexocercosporidium sp. MPI-PUGE-AT-0058]